MSPRGNYITLTTTHDFIMGETLFHQTIKSTTFRLCILPFLAFCMMFRWKWCRSFAETIRCWYDLWGNNSVNIPPRELWVMKSSNTKKQHYCYWKLHRDCMIKDKFIVNTGFGLCEYCMWTVSDKLKILQAFLVPYIWSIPPLRTRTWISLDITTDLSGSSFLPLSVFTYIFKK